MVKTVYKYGGVTIKTNCIQVLMKLDDKSIQVIVSGHLCKIHYLEEKERDDNFELLSDMIK